MSCTGWIQKCQFQGQTSLNYLSKSIERFFSYLVLGIQIHRAVLELSCPWTSKRTNTAENNTSDSEIAVEKGTRFFIAYFSLPPFVHQFEIAAHTTNNHLTSTILQRNASNFARMAENIIFKNIIGITEFNEI